MEEDEMNEIAQQNAHIRDRFLASARQYLLAAETAQDAPRAGRSDSQRAEAAHALAEARRQQAH